MRNTFDRWREQLLGTVRVILLLLLSATVCTMGVGCSAGATRTPARAEAAKSVATGFVMSAAHGDARGVSALQGHPESAEESASLRSIIPTTLGFDPIMYSASITATSDVEGDGVIQVIVREDMIRPPYPGQFVVSLTWAPQDREWRVVQVQYAP